MTCALCSRGDTNGNNSRVLPKTTITITTTTTTTTMMTTTTTRLGGVGAQVSPLFRSPSHDLLMLRYPKSTGEEGRAMTTTTTLVMDRSGSEPWFGPEPMRTKPRFWSRFKAGCGPNLKSGSAFGLFGMVWNQFGPV